jgi:multidrug efflux system outer membrane protein
MKIHLRLFRRSLAEYEDRRTIASPPVLALLPLLLVLGGCMLGPNYRVPNANPPPAFRGASGAAEQASYADLPWWELFHDETLRQLIREALRNNQDMAVATARVEQARELAAQARSEYFPALGYTSIISYGHNQFVGSPASNTQNPQGFLLAIVRASWEADLWGRIRRTNEAARAQLLASEEARRGVMLTLSSDLSQAYFELLGLRYRLDIARNMVQTYTSTLKIFTERFQGGLGNQLQVSRASADLASTAATIPEIERLIALKENQISVLLGKAPGPMNTKVTLLEESVPLNVPAGLPSSLLERRPDVLAAAADVRSANAQIGIARAAYFPSLGLTTFFGKLSTPLADVTSGHTDAWSLGANVAGPIYQGGALKARRRQAVARWEEARARYVQTALNAFRDVSDALISREKYDAVRAQLIPAVQSNEQAVQMSTNRYLEGLSSYNEILEAEQRLYPAQLALADTEVSRRLILVQLYRALGGGWNLSDAQWFAGAPATNLPPPGQK